MTIDVLPPPLQPYFKIFGNDGQAGGAFEDDSIDDCSTNSYSNTTATFLGFNRGTNRFTSGAGAQFALFALGAINGVSSDSLGAPDNPKRETFANDDALEVYGGKSELARCVPNYFGTKTSTTVVEPDGYTISPFAALAANEQRVTYVDGDVYINSNITYGVSGGDSRSFTLIARGNIYVDNDVTQLDGVYVAQNRAGGADGIIYTCARGLRDLPDGTNLSSSCGSQLKVNGAFIAKLIKPWRTNGNMASAGAAETRNDSDIAEIFNFTPDIYLNFPDLNAGGSSSSGEYDSYETVAPIF
jgi:hypothetical protein